MALNNRENKLKATSIEASSNVFSFLQREMNSAHNIAME